MGRFALAVVLPLLLAANAAADGASELGKCKICHSLDKGGPNRVGPDLFGVFGRKAGTVAGYSYSAAMKQSGIVWDDAAMAAFLRDPRAAIPGNHMSFPGIKDEAALADLLAKLKQATQ
ncbi:MAG TPA: c-type cytochrome [Stellaceae bacterium]|nr:c-type cytochrome [Stellaceae bacterium]